MKVYNEIYPAEGRAAKILEYLNHVAEEKPNMYAKTRRRYAQLAYSLLDSVSLILKILEEDSLVPAGTDEFNELSSSEYDKLLNRLSMLNREVQRTDNFSGRGLPKEVPRSSASGSSDSTKGKYFQTIRYFDDVLYEASLYNFGYSEVNRCAKLMYQWFHQRFNPRIPNPEFVCNIKFLPIWIQNFILVYGKFFQDRNVDEFEKLLNDWCSKISKDNHITYAVPFMLYRLDKDLKDEVCNPEDYTIDSIVINDILSNEVLYKLNEDTVPGDVRYDPGGLTIVVKQRNPSLLHKVVKHVAQRQQLVREIGLTPVGGSDIGE